MSNAVQRACDWAIAIANDESHGYDQGHRWGPDYDCSSLLITAWELAGVPVKTNGARRTGDMYKPFLECGFVDVTSLVDHTTGAGSIKGDVWLTPYDHTAMICDDNLNFVEAHSNENHGATGGQTGDQTGGEIDVNPWHQNNPEWTYVLRYLGFLRADKTTVISANRYLSVDEMQPNAVYIAAKLLDAGWTLNAIAGMLGNMQHESTINPGIWQSLHEGNLSGGFGLVQWTPATKYMEWAAANGYTDYTDIDGQIARILWELENGEQFYSTTTYPITFAEFSASTRSAEYLAGAFLYNYERPEEYNIEPRQTAAKYWFTYLSSLTGGFTPHRSKGLSLLLMYAALRR